MGKEFGFKPPSDWEDRFGNLFYVVGIEDRIIDEKPDETNQSEINDSDEFASNPSRKRTKKTGKKYCVKSKMSVPPGSIVKRSKKTGKKYCVKNKWADNSRSLRAALRRTLVDGEIVFQWHHEKTIVVM